MDNTDNRKNLDLQGIMKKLVKSEVIKISRLIMHYDMDCFNDFLKTSENTILFH